MKKLLILGGSGFIGSSIVEYGIDKKLIKHKIDKIYILSRSKKSNTNKKKHIEDFKNKVDIKTNPRKSIVLSIKDLAYNPIVKGIIAFSNSGRSAKLVSTMRPSVKIITISRMQMGERIYNK